MQRGNNQFANDVRQNSNDVIADKNVVTKIMNNSTGLQRIELNGFDERHWKTGYYPFAYGCCLGLCWGLGLYLFFNCLGY